MNKIYDIETQKNYNLPPCLYLFAGTSLKGNIEISYNKLIEKLGKPNQETDEYKTDAQWLINTTNGITTLYNWKDGKNYLKESGKAIEEITDWHIGGFNEESAKELKEFLLK